MVFHALNKEQITEIVDLEIEKVSERLKEHEIQLITSDEARLKLADLGYDPEMGARPLRREIQNRVEDQLSDALLAGTFKSGDSISIDVDGEEIVLHAEKVEPEDEAQEVVPAV
jgi:ATP-dependent Clp protease ATP-binding subunit ClpC